MEGGFAKVRSLMDQELILEPKWQAILAMKCIVDTLFAIRKLLAKPKCPQTSIQKADSSITEAARTSFQRGGFELSFSPMPGLHLVRTGWHSKISQSRRTHATQWSPISGNRAGSIPQEIGPEGERRLPCSWPGDIRACSTCPSARG